MGKSKPEQQSWYAYVRGRLPARSKWVVVLVVVAVAGLAGDRLYRHAQQQLAKLPQYRLTNDSIHVSPPPHWIRTDVKSAVLGGTDALVDVSVLGDTARLRRRLVDAFELHPWVERVERIELSAPADAFVELVYRRPIAVVAIQRGNLVELSPVDRNAVRLPAIDLTETEKLNLPRITDAHAQVLVGEPWIDPRIVGAVNLAAALAEVWESYDFIEIAPSPHAEVRQSQRYYVYEILTNYGTRIRWGAAPGRGPAGEDSTETKLARLAKFVADHGPLNSTYSPQMIDIRDRLIVEARTVQNSDSETQQR